MKKILMGIEGREAVFQGILKAYRAVGITLGPVGKTIMISNGGFAPSSIDDGVTGIRNVHLEDPFEEMGVRSMEDVANDTSRKGGDSTTTSMVLYATLAKFANGEVGTDFSKVREVRERLEGILTDSVTILKDISRPALREDIEKIATSASLDSEAGKLISELLHEVSAEGVITIEESQTLGLSTEVVKGMRIGSGFLSKNFVENTAQIETILEKPYILIADRFLSKNEQIKGILNKVFAANKADPHHARPLIVIAEDVTGEALASMGLNFQHKTIKVVPLKLPTAGPRRKEVMKDIASLTGATLVSEDLGMKVEDADLSQCGTADKVIINAGAFTILEGAGTPDALEARTKALEAEMAQTGSEMDKEALKGRIASLNGGVGVLRVGVYTDSEMEAKRFKLANGINAARNAMQEGVIAGGGTALNFVANSLPDSMAKALGGPMALMSANSGIEDFDGEAFDEAWTGVDFKNQKKVNMDDAGIIDSLKNIRLALEHAVAKTIQLITSETFIVDVQESHEVQ